MLPTSAPLPAPDAGSGPAPPPPSSSSPSTPFVSTAASSTPVSRPTATTIKSPTPAPWRPPASAFQAAITARAELDQRIQKEVGQYVNSSACLRELSRLTPSGIRLTGISLQRDDKNVACNLDGYALPNPQTAGAPASKSFMAALLVLSALHRRRTSPAWSARAVDGRPAEHFQIVMAAVGLARGFAATPPPTALAAQVAGGRAMNLNLDRQFVGHIVTALTLTVGGWMALAAPQADELHEVEKSLANVKGNLKDRRPGRRRATRRPHGAGPRRAREVAAHNRFVGDSAQMYSTIKARAAEHAVAITRIVPGVPVAAKDDHSVQSATFDLTVEGRYEQVAAFLRSLDQTGSFLRPVRLKVTPIQDRAEPRVRCEAGFQTFCFQLPDALKPLAG